MDYLDEISEPESPRGGGLKTGRFLSGSSENQGDLLGTILTSAGIPLERPIGIATKQLPELTTAS